MCRTWLTKGHRWNVGTKHKNRRAVMTTKYCWAVTSRIKCHAQAVLSSRKQINKIFLPYCTLYATLCYPQEQWQDSHNASLFWALSRQTVQRNTLVSATEASNISYWQIAVWYAWRVWYGLKYIVQETSPSNPYSSAFVYTANRSYGSFHTERSCMCIGGGLYSALRLHKGRSPLYSEEAELVVT